MPQPPILPPSEARLVLAMAELCHAAPQLRALANRSLGWSTDNRVIPLQRPFSGDAA